ncbi:MAG: hypothetical protein C4518_05135 [Desulfobacteraceae bacterium]|nr:MAG: hypothetical protein C4518_05135 [Desulfobacteraceae bacterium]
MNIRLAVDVKKIHTHFYISLFNLFRQLLYGLSFWNPGIQWDIKNSRRPSLNAGSFLGILIDYIKWRKHNQSDGICPRFLCF